MAMKDRWVQAEVNVCWSVGSHPIRW
jgi:hypothetical protein